MKKLILAIVASASMLMACTVGAGTIVIDMDAGTVDMPIYNGSGYGFHTFKSDDIAYHNNEGSPADETVIATIKYSYDPDLSAGHSPMISANALICGSGADTNLYDCDLTLTGKLCYVVGTGLLSSDWNTFVTDDSNQSTSHYEAIGGIACRQH